MIKMQLVILWNLNVQDKNLESVTWKKLSI